LSNGGALGVNLPAPQVPINAPGVQPAADAMINTDRYFVDLVRSSNIMTGERLERKMMPLILETSTVPNLKVMGLSAYQKYYGAAPFELSCRWGTKKVALLPGLVSELNAFWMHKEPTMDNYKVLVLKCRELLRGWNVTSQFYEFNLTYAPIASLFCTRQHSEAAILSQPGLELTTVVKVAKWGIVIGVVGMVFSWFRPKKSHA